MGWTIFGYYYYVQGQTYNNIWPHIWIYFKSVLCCYSIGFQVTEQLLDEVATISQVMTDGEDYLSPAVRAECERVIPRLEDVEPQNASLTYIFLKTHYMEPSSQ